MIDEYVNKGQVTANVVWSGVAGLILAAWAVVLLAPGHLMIGGMLAATSCALSAFAAVLHIRCYVVRLAGLVRATGSLERPESPRPVRGL